VHHRCRPPPTTSLLHILTERITVRKYEKNRVAGGGCRDGCNLCGVVAHSYKVGDGSHTKLSPITHTFVGLGHFRHNERDPLGQSPHRPATGRTDRRTRAQRWHPPRNVRHYCRYLPASLRDHPRHHPLTLETARRTSSLSLVSIVRSAPRGAPSLSRQLADTLRQLARPSSVSQFHGFHGFFGFLLWDW
jgi:hypothetical protein